jgi:ABC-2 type transport system permease protein
MLFYKAWLETRVRFLASFLVLSAYCVSFVRGARYGFPPIFEPALPYSAYVWRGVYNGMDMLVFVLVAVLLGLGGIERERASGTAGFTLALPVTRLRLLAPRAMVAMLQMVVLALIPLVVVPWMSAAIGRSYSFADALPFALLFAVTGTVWVAVGLFWSAMVPGEHTSTIASVLTPALYAAALAAPALRRHPSLSLFNVMNGSRLDFLDAATSLVVGPLPWPGLGAVVLFAAALACLAAVVTARRDF